MVDVSKNNLHNNIWKIVSLPIHMNARETLNFILRGYKQSESSANENRGLKYNL